MAITRKYFKPNGEFEVGGILHPLKGPLYFKAWGGGWRYRRTAGAQYQPVEEKDLPLPIQMALLLLDEK